MRSKYKGYCWTCHHTIWLNEEIRFDGKAHHIDCKRALADYSPRVMDSRYIKVYGKVNKSKLRTALRA